MQLRSGMYQSSDDSKISLRPMLCWWASALNCHVALTFRHLPPTRHLVTATAVACNQSFSGASDR